MQHITRCPMNQHARAPEGNPQEATKQHQPHITASARRAACRQLALVMTHIADDCVVMSGRYAVLIILLESDKWFKHQLGRQYTWGWDERSLNCNLLAGIVLEGILGKVRRAGLNRLGGTCRAHSRMTDMAILAWSREASPPTSGSNAHRVATWQWQAGIVLQTVPLGYEASQVVEPWSM